MSEEREDLNHSELVFAFLTRMKMDAAKEKLMILVGP